jgi:glycosyltransferase involved in cell wall biosynthesis
MGKKLSIITVNRNNASGLKQTIASVICQKYIDYEFLIIDGNSDDDSTNVIKENEDKLGYWISEPDQGTYHAMNKGIRKATGEYCLFLNSGDYLLDNTVLEKVFTTSPEEDIISGNVLKIRPNNKYRRVSSPEEVSLHRLCIHSLPHQASFIKTNLFEEIGYYTETYRINSDWEFFLKALILNKKSYRHIDIDVSYFRLGGVSSGETNFDLAWNESNDILTRLFPDMAEDLMEYRYFFNSNIGQIIRLLKKRKWLYDFVENSFGFVLKSKKKVAGK